MKLTPLHERLLADILDLGSPYPLVLTGGYAVQAHGLVERFSRDLDVATENSAPTNEIVASLTVVPAGRSRGRLPLGGRRQRLTRLRSVGATATAAASSRRLLKSRTS